MPFQHLAQQMERLLQKIHSRASYEELYMEALPLFKELSILEDRYKSNSSPAPVHYDSLTEEHIAKAQKKLVKWARDGNAMPSKILDVYLYLSQTRKETFIPVDLLEATFKATKEDIPTFRQNFDQMKNFAEKNHAKIFDVLPNGHITIWPPIQSYVDCFWDTVSARVY